MLEKTMPTPANNASTRLYYMDAFRVAMLLLGIPFHTSEALRSGTPWVITFPPGSDALMVVTHVIHSFRMFAFFMVAGFFSALILSRYSAGNWVAQRGRRLVIPLICSALALAPLEAAVIAWQKTGGVGFASTWWTLLTQGGAIWLLHRWFLVVLVVFTAVVALVAAILQRRPELGRLPLAFIEHRFRLAYTLLFVGLALWGLASTIPFAAPFNFLPRFWFFGLFPADKVLFYAAPFALGCLLAVAPSALSRFARFDMPTLLAALALLAIYISTANPTDMESRVIFRLAVLPCGLLCTQLLLGLAKRCFDRPHPVIARLIDAAFVIYLVHMVFVLVFTQLFAGLGLDPISNALCTIVMTLIASYGLYLVIRPSRLMGILFNGGPFRYGQRDVRPRTNIDETTETKAQASA